MCRRRHEHIAARSRLLRFRGRRTGPARPTGVAFDGGCGRFELDVACIALPRARRVFADHFAHPGLSVSNGLSAFPKSEWKTDQPTSHLDFAFFVNVCRFVVPDERPPPATFFSVVRSRRSLPRDCAAQKGESRERACPDGSDGRSVATRPR